MQGNPGVRETVHIMATIQGTEWGDWPIPKFHILETSQKPKDGMWGGAVRVPGPLISILCVEAVGEGACMSWGFL